MKKHIGKIALGCIAVLVLLCTWYLCDYSKAESMVEEYLQSSEAVEVKQIKDMYFFDGEGESAAFVFYPGGKVEYTAYAPLMFQLAEQGMDCFLVEMPCNLAFLGANKADAILEEYDYEKWYMGGHSLGGAIIASTALKHTEEVSGLILLASYSTADLKETSWDILSVYGDKDGVLNMENLVSGRELMPATYKEVCITGGNHAQFGYYGLQKGDKEASISREEQMTQTIAEIIGLLQK